MTDLQITQPITEDDVRSAIKTLGDFQHYHDLAFGHADVRYRAGYQAVWTKQAALKLNDTRSPGGATGGPDADDRGIAPHARRSRDPSGRRPADWEGTPAMLRWIVQARSCRGTQAMNETEILHYLRACCCGQWREEFEGKSDERVLRPTATDAGRSARPVSLGSKSRSASS